MKHTEMLFFYNSVVFSIMLYKHLWDITINYNANMLKTEPELNIFDFSRLCTVKAKEQSIYRNLYY